MSQRINQQDKVYVAQARSPRGKGFRGISEAYEYLDAVINAEWWYDRFPAVVHVALAHHDRSDGFEGVAAYHGGGYAEIELSGYSMCERSLLHELAHICAKAEMGEGVGHGPHWVRTFLELVFRCMGDKAWEKLRTAFIEGGVALD